jgi:hypothetical protein
MIASSKKYASLCSGESAYLVYRFGRPNSIEFTYPDDLDESSWDKFKLYGYSRGGGIENDAMGDYSLSFSNLGVQYTVVQNWRAIGDEYSVGVLVDTGERRVYMRGSKESQVGSLVLLDENSKIKDEAQQ